LCPIYGIACDISETERILLHLKSRYPMSQQPEANAQKKSSKSSRRDPAKALASARAPDEDVVGKIYDSGLMRRLVRYLAPYKFEVIVSSLAILLKAGLDVAGPALVKVAIDTYLAPDGRPSWFGRHLSAVPYTGIVQLAGIYLVTLILSFGLELVQTYQMQWTGQKIMFDLRKEIFRHIQLQDVGFFDRNPVGRLVTRVTSDVDALNEMFTSGVLAIFENVILLVAIVAIMVKMSWALAILALLVIPIIIFVTGIFRRSIRGSYRRQRAATAKINSFTQEYVSGMSVVQLFNRERRAFTDFSAVNDENKQAWTDAIFAYALYYPIVEFLSSLAIALVLWRGGVGIFSAAHFHWVGAHHYIDPAGAIRYSLFGAVTLGVLVAFIQYAQKFFRPIQELSDKFNILQAAMAAAERIFKLLDEPAQIVSPAHPQTAQPGSPDFGRLEFKDVWFTYARLTEDQKHHLRTLSLGSPNLVPEPWVNDIEWILRGVSFIIHPSETAAIVGHTGAGKTTITALMMRFYDIQRGSILVDGIDVREQNLNKLRKRFGVVLQDPFLFSGTIADNIRLGTSSITSAEIENAADEVNIGDFIRTLPLSFAEPVRERGAGLSTGQKQLISFARALAHSPGILILDEATSSVDTETEHRVRTALARMITGRTSVLIAHRLSTIQSADTILVMHKGTLREQGTHQQLLATHGLYYKLYQLQYQDQEALTA
jgi:ATP-binding cassette subfamily B multidrug efflux pump